MDNLLRHAYNAAMHEIKYGWQGYNNWDEYLDKNIDELLEYSFIPPRLSSLNVPCLIDCDESFKHHKHPMWILIGNGANLEEDGWLPFSIEDNAQMLIKERKTNLSPSDIADIQEFIRVNKNLLSAFANGKKRGCSFISEMALPYNGQNLITEYQKLYPTETNLPVDIWVDDGGTFAKGKHAPRIKFPAEWGDGNTRNYVPMGLQDGTPIYAKSSLPPKVIKAIQQYVARNQELLTALSKKQITLDYYKEKSIPNKLKKPKKRDLTNMSR